MRYSAGFQSRNHNFLFW